MITDKGIVGNRVVGETDERHNGFGIDPQTLEPDYASEPRVKILPGHVHQALREMYALGDANPLASLFPLTLRERLPLLTG